MDKEGLKELGLTNDEILFIEKQGRIFIASRPGISMQDLDIEAVKYALGQLNKKNITYKEAMKVIREELKSDQSGGSIYYGWQSNLAMLIMDNSDLNAEECNIIAIKFLNRLMED